MSSGNRETQTCKFIFTINNVPPEHEIFKDLLEEHVCSADGHDERFFAYICVAPEVAPTTGTPHVQGYCFTRKPVRTTQVVKKFNDMGFTGHQHPFVEKARGTHEDNFNYVQGTVEKKGNVLNPNFKEFGVRPTFETQAERQKKDYQTTRDLAMQGRFLEIAPQHFICHFRSLVAISERYSTPPADLLDVCGIWIWGLPGTGKSYFARTNEELYGETTKRFYVKNLNKWWCGYRPEDHDRVIIDDFELSAGASLGHFVKIWADRYAFQAEIKGGSSFIRPKSITITSNYHPLEVFRDALNNSAGPYQGDESLAGAILRRFRVFKCEKSGDNRTFTYEPETGTLRFTVSLPPSTAPSFNLSPIDVSMEIGRTLETMAPSTVAVYHTPTSVEYGQSVPSSVVTPVTKSTAGAAFRTPESPRNVALKAYMQPRLVPGRTDTQEEESSDEEIEDEDDEEERVLLADFAKAVTQQRLKDSPKAPEKKEEIVDLTADSDEETVALKPPKLQRSQTIVYNAVRAAPAPLIDSDKKRAKNDN